MTGLVLLWLCVMTGGAPSTAPEESVDALVARLSSDEWQARQAAEDRLVQLGATAHEALARAARETDDPETRTRAEAALARIAENARTGASVITIKGESLTLREVVSQLSEQAGVPIDIYPPVVADHHRAERYRLDIDHQSFWEAIRNIGEATGFSIQQWDHTGVKFMQGGPPIETGGVISGAFLITATRVSRSRAVDLPAAAGVHEDFHVHMVARAEPKLRLLRVSYTPRLIEAVDENGLSLLQRAGGYSVGSGYGSVGMWNLAARLECPPDVGRRIARLRGTIDVSIQTGTELLEVPDIQTARNVSRVVGTLGITINELTRSGDDWQLRITARPQGASAEEWEHFKQTLTTADVRLLDEEGDVLPRSSYSSSGTPERVELNLTYQSRPQRGNRPAAGEPVRMVWSVPTGTRDLSVPFEFEDLPIP